MLERLQWKLLHLLLELEDIFPKIHILSSTGKQFGSSGHKEAWTHLLFDGAHLSTCYWKAWFCSSLTFFLFFKSCTSVFSKWQSFKLVVKKNKLLLLSVEVWDNLRKLFNHHRQKFQKASLENIFGRSHISSSQLLNLALHYVMTIQQQ